MLAGLRLLMGHKVRKRECCIRLLPENEMRDVHNFWKACHDNFVDSLYIYIQVHPM